VRTRRRHGQSMAQRSGSAQDSSTCGQRIARGREPSASEARHILEGPGSRLPPALPSDDVPRRAARRRG
jgi:hypothetical protein